MALVTLVCFLLFLPVCFCKLSVVEKPDVREDFVRNRETNLTTQDGVISNDTTDLKCLAAAAEVSE